MHPQTFLSKKYSYLLLLVIPFFPKLVFAHEEYVLTKEQINTAVAVKGINVFSALNNPGNLRVGLSVAILSLVGIILYFFFQQSELGKKLDNKLNSLEPFGHTILRIALASSLIASAYFNSFLGPEIHLSSIPFAEYLKPALYIVGGLMLFGLWSEFTGVAALIILLLCTWVYKEYMLTYFNYFGEFIALILFGSRTFSLDKLLYKAKAFAEKYHNAELALIRITYGISVIYPAITYKIIHPQVIIQVAQQYNLMQFHWLFPQDPLLIALGTGMAQIAVGICLILGFQTRLNTLVTFGLMVLSVAFFKESVWPHIILLALAIYLFFNNGGTWSLDNYLQKNITSLKNKFLAKAS